MCLCVKYIKRGGRGKYVFYRAQLNLLVDSLFFFFLVFQSIYSNLPLRDSNLALYLKDSIHVISVISSQIKLDINLRGFLHFLKWLYSKHNCCLTDSDSLINVGQKHINICKKAKQIF